MGPLAIVTAILLMAGHTHGTALESLEDVLVYPVEVQTNIQKRDTRSVKSDIIVDDFLEDKLIQHSQALEHLMRITQNMEDTIEQLVENLSKKVIKPTMPEKIEFISRRSSDGKSVYLPTSTTENNDDNNKISPWCSVAMLCKRTVDPICGYDDNFGYGKFDDICHMIQVNCYWKYNFALVPTCKPSL